MKKVVCVLGFIGKQKDMRVIKSTLVNFELIYFDYDTSLRESLEKTAYLLKKFIDKLKLKAGEKVDIIGLSAGGVIADYYLKFLDNKKVRKFVSLNSPFKGTYLASVPSKRKGLHQLRKNSSFLKKLNKKKMKNVKAKNIYSKYDFAVPGDSGRGVNPKLIPFFLHPLVPYWPPILNQIKKFLEE